MEKKSEVLMYYVEMTLFGSEEKELLTYHSSYYSFPFAVEESVKRFENWLVLHPKGQFCIIKIVKGDEIRVGRMCFFRH